MYASRNIMNKRLGELFSEYKWPVILIYYNWKKFKWTMFKVVYLTKQVETESSTSGVVSRSNILTFARRKWYPLVTSFNFNIQCLHNIHFLWLWIKETLAERSPNTGSYGLWASRPSFLSRPSISDRKSFVFKSQLDWLCIEPLRKKIRFSGKPGRSFLERNNTIYFKCKLAWIFQYSKK